MSPVSALPGHLEASPASVEIYTRAFAEMPPNVMPEIVARIEAGVEHVERTGDVAPLRHVLDSLVMTARLHNNQAYVLNVADADAADGSDADESEDVASFVSRMREKYTSP
jgi:hypothetical protein